MSDRLDAYFETRMAFHPGRAKVWRAVADYLRFAIPANASVLELGAGYGDLIRQVAARRAVAVDLKFPAREPFPPPCRGVVADVRHLPFAADSFDVVMASNLLEHLNDGDLAHLFSGLGRILRKGGTLILIQPNYHFCYRNYWDDFTHVKAWSDASLCDFLSTWGYTVTRREARFLPFSFKSRLPKSRRLTALYLRLPYRPMAAQMLVIAQR